MQHHFFFFSCGMQTLSCSAACGIFSDQGSNPCPLHWQADSQPLCHQGSPWARFWHVLIGGRLKRNIFQVSTVSLGLEFSRCCLSKGDGPRDSRLPWVLEDLLTTEFGSNWACMWIYWKMSWFFRVSKINGTTLYSKSWYLLCDRKRIHRKFKSFIYLNVN